MDDIERNILSDLNTCPRFVAEPRAAGRERNIFHDRIYKYFQLEIFLEFGICLWCCGWAPSSHELVFKATDLECDGHFSYSVDRALGPDPDSGHPRSGTPEKRVVFVSFQTETLNALALLHPEKKAWKLIQQQSVCERIHAVTHA